MLKTILARGPWLDVTPQQWVWNIWISLCGEHCFQDIGDGGEDNEKLNQTPLKGTG
jgi:hypothetical protein